MRDLAEGTFLVECLLREDYVTVARLATKYQDLTPGLADLSLVILARRHGTRRLLTFDHRAFRAVAPLQGGAFTAMPADRGAD